MIGTHNRYIISVFISNSEELVASGCADETIGIWSIENVLERRIIR